MKILAIGLLAVMMVQCEESECGCPEDQPVYFQYHYVNHAWGTQERGWLIDGHGIVRYFESPEAFRLPDSSGLISMEDLAHNLSQTDSVISVVDQEELDEYIAYIPGHLLAGRPGAKNIAADAGASVLSCYMYDQEEDAYRFIFLAKSGDWEQFNLSAEAEILAEWLIEFGVFWLSE